MHAENSSRLCPLCGGAASAFYESRERIYSACQKCRGIFLPRKLHLSKEDEKNRYLEHNNDVNDPAYRKFAEPVVNYILQNFTPGKHEGLDFGSGTGPVITRMLEEKGFGMSLYDPFFGPETLRPGRTYDFIAACEVIEHFRNPYAEFKLLRGLVKPRGELILKTDIYDGEIPFEKWYYKNDPTHVFFYRPETFEWIKNEFGFRRLIIDERIIILSS